MAPEDDVALTVSIRLPAHLIPILNEMRSPRRWSVARYVRGVVQRHLAHEYWTCPQMMKSGLRCLNRASIPFGGRRYCRVHDPRAEPDG